MYTVLKKIATERNDNAVYARIDDDFLKINEQYITEITFWLFKLGAFFVDGIITLCFRDLENISNEKKNKSR